MEDDIFDNLPDDHEDAFIVLETYYRKLLDEAIHGSEDGGVIAYHKTKYMNNVVAVARSLEIDFIKDFDPPSSGHVQWELFDEFDTAVSNIAIQIRLNSARLRKSKSVALSPVEKTKIRHYLIQIKEEVDKSNLSKEKKDQIYKRLSALEAAIDKDRTPLEAIGDAVRSFAHIVGDAEEGGLRPLWKYLLLIAGDVEGAKEAERRNLPSPADRKRIEAPKKQLPKPDAPQIGRRSKPFDDDIPF